MSQQKKIGESRNFALWERVFAQVSQQSGGKVALDGDWIEVQDLAGGDYPELSMCGVFEKDGTIVTVTFDYCASHDDISNVKYE